MTIFFTSDHHFSHKNIIQLCNRPFNSVEEMDEEMIKRWNSVVKTTDIVWYLGDFSLSIKPVENYLHRLNGIKGLIPGNHDLCHKCHKKSESYIRKYRSLGFGIILAEVYDLIGDKDAKDLEKISLNHFPFNNGEDIRYQEYWPVNFGQWLLHGHVHNKWKVKNKQINIGVDQWDFYPVSLDKILEIIKEGCK